MGFDVSGENKVRGAIRRLRELPWRGRVSPSSIVTAEAPLSVSFAAPTTTRRITWEFVSESGTRTEGSTDWEAAPQIGAASLGGKPLERRLVEIDLRPEPGYHRLTIGEGEPRYETLIVATPNRAFLPEAFDEPGVWGVSVQLYSLRSARNWGIGDFTDLSVLAALGSRHGAWVTMLNPLHALQLTNPTWASPYSASSRLFLNALYLDPEAIPDFAQSAEAQRAVGESPFAKSLEELRAATLVEYDGVANAKLPVLKLLFASFREQHLNRDTDRGRSFSAFRQAGGVALERFALHEAIAGYLHERDGVHHPWPAWPEELRDVSGTAVARFAREYAHLIEQAIYLQWMADAQLAAAAERGGVLRDLAVGVDAGGSDAWSDSQAFAHGASLGAPPDPLNERGQDWGLMPLNPRTLQRRRFESVITMLRANMRHARALRMDHVMSLTRAYLIPVGASAADGAYVRYPLDDLLGILTLESTRSECVVVGEDLGTVPDGFRERLARSAISGCRLFIFERDGARFRMPEEYPRFAAASVATHDLPPLALWWSEADDGTRNAATDALLWAHCIDDGQAHRLRTTPPDDAGIYELLGPAVLQFLARSNAAIALLQYEDVFGERERTNVPGTVFDHPNWRVKRGVHLEVLAEDPRFDRFASLFVTRQDRYSE